jgi:group I intron endonuclease
MGYIYMLMSPTGKSYIGQTFRPIEKRLEEHRTGQNIGCRAIYNAIQYHGWESFEKDWYECPDEDLNFDEGLLVREMGTLAPGGYNLKEGGGNGKLSEETKQKIGEAQRGDKHHMFGKTHSEETKQRMSEAHRGENSHMYGTALSEETRQKISEAKKGDKHHMYGKKHAKEIIQKMSDSKKGEKHNFFGKFHTYETKQKMSEAKKGDKHHMFGKTHSEETKRKISDAKRRKVIEESKK